MLTVHSRNLRLSQKILVSIYLRLVEQKHLLASAGEYLTYNLDLVDENALDTYFWENIEQQTAQVVSYLLQVSDVMKADFSGVLQKIEREYKNQPYWCKILFDFMDYTVEKEAEAIRFEKKQLLEDNEELMYQIRLHEEQERTIIKTFAAKVKEAGFKVDAEKLFKNYIKMMHQDEERAWEVLITNPALFSPILVRDAGGRVVLLPDQAVEENKKLAKFLKHLRV